MKKEETNRERFVRIAESRTQKIIDMLELLGNCSNPYSYEYTKKDVEKMYVETSTGNLHAPFYTLEETTDVYNKLKKSNDILSHYNEYDFYVTMNMIATDNHNLYKKRFPNYGKEMITELYIEDALNWLDDKDNPYGTSKIWKYLNK